MRAWSQAADAQRGSALRAHPEDGELADIAGRREADLEPSAGLEQRTPKQREQHQRHLAGLRKRMRSHPAHSSPRRFISAISVNGSLPWVQDA